MQSIAAIAFLLLCGALIAAGIRKLLDRLHLDRRTTITLRTITSLAVQTVTILLVLLIIFGAPSQLATIIGIATAGLTVVFQGFILAFFGWFILMGKNGIRVGDWVEINGVGGEVVEIGLFRTALLETGNWTDRGHPTGRRVIFMNSFAISGQYFNFSTSGQWLWDEIRLTLPSNPRTYRVIDSIHKALELETAKDAEQAKAEWKRATRDQGLSQFTAEPSIDLRPAASGVEVVVRYVTRASDRFATRNRLYQAVLDLMYKDEEEPALSAGDNHA
jgi:small-conductance mechanosensitive channel